MKLSDRDKGLLLIVFGILIVLGVHSLVYTPALDEIEILETQIESLKQEEAMYEELENNREFYLEETVKLTNAVNEVLAEFPAGIQPESEIMYVVELEENIEVEIPSITYGSASPISGETRSGIAAYVIPMGLTYKTDYQGLKDLITYNNEHPNRMVIDSISVAYDATTGNVSGSLTNLLYFMTGTEAEYKDPEVPNMDIGVDNIFGTIE